MMMINGVVTDNITARDRGLQFGDGCFTTARVRQGGIIWQKQHLERLQTTCQRLKITGVDWPKLSAEMQQLAALQQEGALKVIITRGTGRRGYSSGKDDLPNRILSCSGYPAHYDEWRKKGVHLRQASISLAITPLLAGLKHLNRLEQVLIRAELDAHGAEEALVLDTDGRVVECCAANLFWRKGTKLFTPDLSYCGVEGVARNQLLMWAEKRGYSIAIVREFPEILAEADEVLICNALMPVLPVRRIEESVYHSRSFYQQITADHDEWR